jgi:hypothetical protein
VRGLREERLKRRVLALAAAVGEHLRREAPRHPVAARGVTVVVETHSDHVLNGVRRAVRDAVTRAGAGALQPRLPKKR